MNERELFIQALQIHDPARRLEMIREAACGDDALSQGVESLLRAYAQAGDFLEASPAACGAMPDLTELSESLGAMIGPYKPREVLGEGGMGIVYVAEQERPIRRRVALKVIKPGMDTREVIARF